MRSSRPVNRLRRTSYLPLVLLSLAITSISILGSASLLPLSCSGCDGKGRILVQEAQITRSLSYKSGCCESWWESKEPGYSIACGICHSKGRISRLKQWSLYGRTATYEMSEYRLEEMHLD